ncbi:MAG: MBL fold metallo-hydrolase [Ruminococcaceae bacterium]|nr:MBL fold metallo-hydrolase [Oscillospiraceae bacterium]
MKRIKRWICGLFVPILLLFSGCSVAYELLKSLDELRLSDLEQLLSSFLGDSVELADANFDSDAPLLQVYVIDCGQGDSIFAVFPTGETMLVDGSTQDNAKDVTKFLDAFNISAIDYVVATHPHEDHIGGLDDCLAKYKVGQIFMPAVEHTTVSFERLLDAVEAQNLQIDIPEAGEYIVGDKNSTFSVQCLAPNSAEYEEMNNYSIVLRIVYGERAVLLTGDAEALSEEEILAAGFDVSADVLKLGHHGSSTSSSEEFIAAVAPTYAVASCGKDNDYGHPHREIRSLAQKLGWIFYRTDTDGTVAILSDGNEISVQALGK